MRTHGHHDRRCHGHPVVARSSSSRSSGRRTIGSRPARAVACAEDDAARAVRHTELRIALSRREFRLHYQPIVRVDTGTVVGGEALLRWDHPRHGLLRPDAFLDEAANAGLLARIGEWMLDEAVAERGRWPEGTCVNVNVSPAELETAVARDLPRRLARTCRTSGVDPYDVVIELTEQAITDHHETMTALALLSEVGVRIALDDFGAGYASLARLRGYPFDVCKLDRSFVGMMSEPGGVDVVRAALRIAQVLGMDVVAEGVESVQQLTHLDTIGCDLVQGYRLCGPLPAAEMRQLFDQPGRVLLDAASYPQTAG